MSSNSTDYKTVKAKCGNEVTADVIVCEVKATHIKFDHSAGDGSDGIDIKWNASTDVSVPEWVTGGQNMPAAYKAGITPTIQTRLTVSPAVSVSAAISVHDQANMLDEEGVTFSSGVSSPEYVSFSLSSSYTSSSVGIVQPSFVWKVTDFEDSPQDTFQANTSGPHKFYVVLGTPVTPESEPRCDILEYACTWAGGSTSGSGACADILTNGFVAHYTWDFDCHRLSSDFVRLVTSLGVSASQHWWSSKSPFAVDDMTYQRTKSFDAVGPTHGNTSQDWAWHQWAEAESNQRDPSAGVSLSGTWGDYEDDLFTYYKKVDTLVPLAESWVANNAGQSTGCEASTHRQYSSSPAVYTWRGPDR